MKGDTFLSTMGPVSGVGSPQAWMGSLDETLQLVSRDQYKQDERPLIKRNQCRHGTNYNTDAVVSAFMTGSDKADKVHPFVIFVCVKR